MRDNLKARVAVVVVLMFMVAGAGPPLVLAQDQFFRQKGEWEPRREDGRKLDLLYKASRVYLFAGTSLDMVSTARALDHPTVARRTDGSVLGRYPAMETGWAGRFGRRNTTAIVAAHVGLNTGIDLLSRRIYRRGGRWRILAIALNVLKGTDNMVAGIQNIRYSRALDRQVVEATGYKGSIVWSR